MDLVPAGAYKILDFDNTLCRTSSYHQASFNHVLNALGIQGRIPKPYVSLLRGTTDLDVFLTLLAIVDGRHHGMLDLWPELTILPSKLDEAFPGLILEEQLDRCIAERRRHLLEAVKEKLPEEMPGLGKLMAWLRKTGTRCGIASASPESFVEAVLKGKRIDDVFPVELVVGSETIEKEEARQGLVRGSLSKPNPFSVFRAAEMMTGKQNHQIAYIGDSRTDCECILASDGAFTGIIINSDPEKRTGLEKEFPGLVFLDTLADLLK